MVRNKIFEYEWKKYKKCANCNIKREVKDFQKNWYSKTWLITYKPKCKFCFNLIKRNERIINPESNQILKEKRREYCKTIKEKIKIYWKKRYNNLEPKGKKELIKRTKENRHKRNWKIQTAISRRKNKILKII